MDDAPHAAPGSASSHLMQPLQAGGYTPSTPLLGTVFSVSFHRRENVENNIPNRTASGGERPAHRAGEGEAE